MPHDLELLAPAGDWAALQAALDAGADAVYLGLRTLNARRRAKNFSPDEFVKAVETAHAKGAKVYLTLNIDLAQRELGQAARILQLARQSRADAVLVRDPALLALRSEYPELEFHMSTQTCMANSADVAAAAELGAQRAVLAREMTLPEIAAASAVPNIKTEAFVQGALCFSVSGRCLLSSWAGGRSGNRGTCTSPCRVPWSMRAGQFIAQFNVNDEPADTPLSMKDLSLIDRLPELRQAGVSALKIEGRLKNAAWVGRAVDLFKHALAGNQSDKEILLKEAEQLGLYTGRTMTSAYLDARRDNLTAQAEGRQSSAEIFEDTEKLSPLPLGEDQGEGSADLSPLPTNLRSVPGATTNVVPEGEGIANLSPLPTNLRSVPGEGQGEGEESTYNLRIMIEPKGIACSCLCGTREEKWTIPKTVIHRPHKALAVGALLDQLAQGTLHGFQLGRCETNDPDFLLTPRAANALVNRILKTIRLAQKSPYELVRIDLPPAVSDMLVPREANKANRRCLGEKPNWARLDAKDLPAFLRLRPAKRRDRRISFRRHARPHPRDVRKH